MRIALLLCVLGVAACGASNQNAADAPSITAGDSQPGSHVTTPPATTTDPNVTVNATATTPDMQGSTTATTGGQATNNTHTTGTTATPSTTSPSYATPTDNTVAPAPNTPNVVDNTKNNTRDRSGSTLTPLNQGNSADETRITATIRRGLMGDKSLSFNAKNVKVITIGTKVTLRGVVATDAEKASIETRAKQTSGVTDVDNQLEVKK